MSVERNKAIVRRLFEVWNTGNLDAIGELYAADYVADYRPYAPLRHGYDAIKGMVQRAHVAFPDYHEELAKWSEWDARRWHQLAAKNGISACPCGAARRLGYVSLETSKKGDVRF